MALDQISRAVLRIPQERADSIDQRIVTDRDVRNISTSAIMTSPLKRLLALHQLHPPGAWIEQCGNFGPSRDDICPMHPTSLYPEVS